MVPHVHITPMRASRALALRFLATKFGLGMDAFTVRAWRTSQAGFMCIGACNSVLAEVVCDGLLHPHEVEGLHLSRVARCAKGA